MQNIIKMQKISAVKEKYIELQLLIYEILCKIIRHIFNRIPKVILVKS